MTLEDLVAEFGRPIPEAVFAVYLGIDARTMRKYADHWGGVEIIPGRYAFFESQVRKVIENAKPVLEKRHILMAWRRRSERRFPRKMAVGQLASGPARGRNTENGAGKEGTKGRRADDPFGLLDDD